MALYSEKVSQGSSQLRVCVGVYACTHMSICERYMPLKPICLLVECSSVRGGVCL